MRILRHPSGGEFQRRLVLTIGNFDGIHIGHQALLARLVTQARRIGADSALLSFEPHPLKVLSPWIAPKLILSRRDRIELIAKRDIDWFVLQKFDLEFSRQEAREFARHYLADTLHTTRLVVGSDFAFGCDRKGRVDDLVSFGEELGFDVEVFDPVRINGKRVSCSLIRELIRTGKVNEVPALLGRHHFVTGRVVRGYQRGVRLGFPTANLLTDTEMVPPDGVYATLTRIGKETFQSVANIGTNPTFGSTGRTIEVHIFDFSRDIYGKRIRVDFVECLRDEIKFPSVQVLVEQIQKDAAQAREILKAL